MRDHLLPIWVCKSRKVASSCCDHFLSTMEESKWLWYLHGWVFTSSGTVCQSVALFQTLLPFSWQFSSTFWVRAPLAASVVLRPPTGSKPCVLTWNRFSNYRSLIIMKTKLTFQLFKLINAKLRQSCTCSRLHSPDFNEIVWLFDQIGY